MTLVGISLMVIMVLVIFSLVLGNDFLGVTSVVGVDNISIINGSSTTYVVPSEAVLFNIDTSTLINSGIAILITIIGIAVVTGVQVLGSGLSPASVRIFILLTGYIGIWAVLSILAFNLIISIALFGITIYVTLTIAYTIGVIQKLTGSE